MSIKVKDILLTVRDLKYTMIQEIPPAMSPGTETGGHFSTIRLIFCYIDVFGFLYKGKNSSINSIEFIKDYMGHELNRYSEIPGLLYSIYRHGTVHIF
ncbi:MAG: hypothetical protein KAJ51_07585, partial [Thermoplasmata archaeon]|nr:hypothetical protein [Thermoplasmata archaeon]